MLSHHHRRSRSRPSKRPCRVYFSDSDDEDICPPFSSHFPPEVIDEIIKHLLTAPVGSYADRDLWEIFENVSLVNKAFRSSACRHSHLFYVKRFEQSLYGMNRLRKYMEFLKEYPCSTIPRRIRRLELDGRLYDSVPALISWETLFPNIKELEVTQSTYQVKYKDQCRLVDAMRGIIASPKLQSLALHGFALPTDFFQGMSLTLKKLESEGNKDLDGYVVYPKGLESLILGDIADVDLAEKSRTNDPTIFSGVKKLSIYRYSDETCGKAGRFISQLKNSLEYLEIAPDVKKAEPTEFRLDDSVDVLKLNALQTLQLTARFENSPSRCIPWLSWIFRSVGHVHLHKPTFTLKLVLHQQYESPEIMAELAMVDEWIVRYKPVTLRMEVVIKIRWRLSPKDDDIWKRAMRKCDRRGVLEVEFGGVYLLGQTMDYTLYMPS